MKQVTTDDELVRLAGTMMSRMSARLKEIEGSHRAFASEYPMTHVQPCQSCWLFAYVHALEAAVKPLFNKALCSLDAKAGQ